MRMPDDYNNFMLQTLNERSLEIACAELADRHDELRLVFDLYGVPPLWDREPGFATLLRIILEQQVSLASAKACFDKLAVRIGDVSPIGVMMLSDDELRQVGFSRQKTAYARHLATALLDRTLDLESVANCSDAEAKAHLLSLKGVGEWTSDIYLLMALLRPDIMPRGDIALHAAWSKLAGGPRPNSDEFVAMAEQWSPYRSTVARLLWHFYLSEKASRSVSADAA